MKKEFEKTKDYIVCIDSDGCAMDTMDVKHEEFFGPYAAELIEEKDRPQFMKKWLQVNLFSQTRGINRFKGFLLTLEYFQQKGLFLVDLKPLKQWIETTDELSNKSLEKEIAKSPAEILDLALTWSHKVNEGISTKMNGRDVPFIGVKETIEEIAKFSNIAIVSSANNEAIVHEWTKHELISKVDLLFGQEQGTKAECIQKIKELGYEDDHILMVGDAPGDLKAAEVNSVLFYPILFGKESESWKHLKELISHFVNGTYLELDAVQVKEEFTEHLKHYKEEA